jgi:hypothetical protein
MPVWKYSGLGSRLIAFLMGTVVPFHFAYAKPAGTVGAVNNDAKGTPPGAATKPLSVGQNVMERERVETNANGTVHIIFNDRSALNIGRNASIVIDNFTYQPEAGAGSMALSLGKGVARFVGGQVSHSSGATVKTPVALVGIRGGNITVNHGPKGTIVMVHNGIATVSNQFGKQTARAGFQIIVGPNSAPAAAEPINMGQLRLLTLQLASQGVQKGGTIRQPDKDTAGRAKIGSPRAPARTPNFDLPAAGDDIVRGYVNTSNQPYP